MSNTPKPWNDDENRAIAALYFAMLHAERRSIPYSKAAMIRNAMGCPKPTDRDPNAGHGYASALKARSKGSIEAKLMNCSAAHRDLNPNTETMDGHGYRALSNYQASLKVALTDALAGNGQPEMEVAS